MAQNLNFYPTYPPINLKKCLSESLPQIVQKIRKSMQPTWQVQNISLTLRGGAEFQFTISVA
jgi:hypothetical protein